MIVGVVVAVIAAVVPVIVLNGGDDPKNTAGDSGNSDGGGNPQVEIPVRTCPVKVATPAATAGTRATPVPVTRACLRRTWPTLGRLAAYDGITTTVGDVTENGRTATASIELSAGGQTETFTLEMADEGSGWCATESDHQLVRRGGTRVSTAGVAAKGAVVI